MKNKTLAIYDTASASLTELEAQFGEVAIDLSTKSGIDACKKTATKFQKLRTGVENTRKEANAEANKHIKSVNGQAKSIQERIAPLEERFAKPIKERKDRLTNSIKEIDGLVDVCQGQDSAFISGKLEWLECVDPLDFAEYKKDCEASLFTANDKLTTMLVEASEREEEARKQVEREKQMKIDNSINQMKAMVADVFDAPRAVIQKAFDEVCDLVIDSSYGDRQEEADEVKLATQKKLSKLIEMADDKEESSPFVDNMISEEDEAVFNDCIADAKPVTESVNLRAQSFSKLLEITQGDYDLSNTLLQEIEQGRLPGVTAKF